MIIGVADTAANVEFADIKVVGFLSSCSGAIVTISAVEVDPCTGLESYRQIGTAAPKQETRCKWEARIATAAQAPYTREYSITTNTPVKEIKDGVQAGRILAAVSEWIFPEVDVPGTNPPAFPFNGIRDLVQGTVLNGKQYGPLSPFPGASPPSPSKTCSPSDLVDPNAIPTSSPFPSSIPTTDTPALAPVAAVAQFTLAQRVGTNFLLVGSNTESKVSANDLVFKWSQTSPASPAASITNANAANATIAAPKVTGETSFTFDLLISLKSNTSMSSRANVTVKISPSLNDTVTLDTYTWESRQGGSINVGCTTDVVNGDNKKMSLWMNNGVLKVDMTGNGVGKWAYIASRSNKPTNLKCVSDLKGESALRLGTQTTVQKRGFVRW
jgi:hypothetical protein